MSQVRCLSVVMPGLVPGIHVLAVKKGVDGRDIGERSDAVLRTAMPGHDGRGDSSRPIIGLESGTEESGDRHVQ